MSIKIWKKFGVMLSLTVSPILSTAQISNIQGRPNSILRENNLNIRIVGDQFLFTGIKSAKVVDQTGAAHVVLARFDKLNNEFEIFNDDGNLLITKFLYPFVRIEYFNDELEKRQVHTFKNQLNVKGYPQHHYFEVLDESNGSMILKDYFTSKIDTEVSQYGRDDFTRREFKTVIKYFYIRGGSTYEIKNRSRSITSIFKSQIPELKKYIKKNKIRFGSEEQLVQVLRHINTLDI